MAEIIFKGKNRWLVRVFLRRVAGRTKYHNKVVHGTKKIAQKYAREAETKRDLGILNKPSSEDVTLEKFLDGWLSQFKKGSVKERTYEGYVFVLDNYVRPYLGKDHLTELTARRIQSLYNDLTESGYSPRTVAFAHSLLRDALNQAVVDDLLVSNPTFSTRRPPRVKKGIDVFSPEEAERFIKAAMTDRLGIVFWFALALGPRPEEYTALQWRDLDLQKCEAFFHRSVWWPSAGGWKIDEVKTQSSLRTVNFSPVLAEALVKHKRAQSAYRLRRGKKFQNNDLVFASSVGTPMTLKNLARRHLAPIMKRAKIEGQVNLYRLRHSFVTLSLLAGADVKSVSRAAGHSSVWFTQDTYQHVLPAMRQDAADKIGRLLFGSV
jgi:integrase